MTKRTNRSYTAEFKQEAVALVTEQGYSVAKTAAFLGITDKLLYNWKAKFEAEQSGASLKHDWLLKVPQLTRAHMRNDVMAYMRYYNLERLHTANGDESPVEYEQSSLRKVS